jgi:TonB family protein
MQRQTETSSALISETFGLLPQPVGRLRSFVESLAVNVALGSLLLWFTMTHLPKAPPAPQYVNELAFLKHPSAITPPIHIKVRPLPIPVSVKPSRIETPRPLPQTPKPETVTLKTPPMPVIPLPPAKVVVAAAQPRVGVFAAPKVTNMTNSKSTPAIKAGGFGDPSGVAVNPNATRPATIAPIGSFSNTPGGDLGAGGAHGGVVKAGAGGSGMGNSVEGARGSGGGHGTVATGGFGGNDIGSGGSAQQTAVQQVNMTPPQVLSEPHPRYTEEAKQLKIQGEITLQVRFGVDGKVEVLRVVNGLGHGLDEEARRVAEQIQFKPAARNGQPADDVTYIHILFQLA